MRIHAYLFLVLLALSEPGRGEQPSEPKKTVVTSSADSPLPAGAIMRLGESRFRPGNHVTALVFSPDGKQLASCGHWQYFEDRLSIWDTATGKEVRTYAIDENQLAYMCWGSGGRAFMLLGRPGNHARDQFRVWAYTDLDDKPPQKKPLISKRKWEGIGVKKAGGEKAPPRPETYDLFTFSKDGRRLAACGSRGENPDRFIDIFEAKSADSGTKLKRLARQAKLPQGECSGIQFVRDGQAVVILNFTADRVEQTVVTLDIEKQTVSTPFTIPVGVRQGMGIMQSFDATEDGSAVAVGLADGTIKVYDLLSGKERLSVKKHGKEVSAIKFVNGNRNLLSAGRDNRMLVWNAKTGEDVAVLDGHHFWIEAVAVSADGKRVATAGQGALIRLWDAQTWQPVLPPQGPCESIHRVEVSRDGKYALAAGWSAIHVWEMASGREVWSTATDSKFGYALFSPTGDVLTGNSAGPLCLYSIRGGEPKRIEVKGRLLDFAPDGKSLLTSLGNTLLIWDWPAGTKRAEIILKLEASSCAISPDGKKALVTVPWGVGAALIDLKAKRVVAEMPFKLQYFARSAGYSLDGRLVCGTVRDQAETWNIATSSRVRQFEEPPGIKTSRVFMPHSFVVSSNGQLAAGCHSDGSVVVYETVTGEVLANFLGHREGAIGLALTPDGNRVLSGGCDHQVLVWDVSLAKLAGKVSPLTAADRAKAWDQLGTQPAKEAIKTMGAFVKDPDATIALFTQKLRPVTVVDSALLDRIIRNLDDPQFSVREKSNRELNGLGIGAVSGVRERATKAQSNEVKQRAAPFLRRFELSELTPHHVRTGRALHVLGAINTPAAREFVEKLAGGASEAWETEVAMRTLAGMVVPDDRK